MSLIRYGAEKEKLLSWMTPWFLALVRACTIHYDKKHWNRIGSGKKKKGRIIISLPDLLVWRDSETFNW